MNSYAVANRRPSSLTSAFVFPYIVQSLNLLSISSSSIIGNFFFFCCSFGPQSKVFHLIAHKFFNLIMKSRNLFEVVKKGFL